MLGQRIKQFRLAKGWSQDELVSKLDHIVTKTALSKYERGLMKPSLTVLKKIAKLFNVKLIQLNTFPNYTTELIAYRKRLKLSKKNEEIIENVIKVEMENRLSLLEQLNLLNNVCISFKEFTVNSFEDCETAAETLRNSWNIGNNPIANLTSILEENNINVFFIDADTKFDGISLIVKNSENNVVAAAVVSRNNLPWSRQRLNIAHELGHLFLNVNKTINEEKAAFRFAAALLAPQNAIFAYFGKKRSVIQLDELFIFKKLFGISAQALIYRLGDLNIITQTYKTSLFKLINYSGFKINEPFEMKPENSSLFINLISRAYSEKLISIDETNKFSVQSILGKQKNRINDKLQFMQLGTIKKKEYLQKNADAIKEHYFSSSEWKDFLEGDIIEY